MDEVDLYRSAWLLIEKHGEDAPLIAAMRADEMLENGDLDGKITWLKIKKAITELQRNQRKTTKDFSKIAVFHINCQQERIALFV